MNWLSDKIIKFRKTIVGFFLVLTVAMLVCFTQVKINYNMQDYLPEDANSTKAIAVMSENFDESIANANVLVQNVTVQEAIEFKQKILDIEGVEDVNWLDKSIDIEKLNQLTKEDGTLATEMLDETTRGTVEGYYKDKNALFQVTIENGKEKDIVNAIYELIGEEGAMNGTAVEQASSQNLAIEQTVKAISLIAPIIIVILILATKSWIEPFLYLTAICSMTLRDISRMAALAYRVKSPIWQAISSRSLIKAYSSSSCFNFFLFSSSSLKAFSYAKI